MSPSEMGCNTIHLYQAHMGYSACKSLISFSFWVPRLPNNDGIIESLKQGASRIDASSRDRGILGQGESRSSGRFIKGSDGAAKRLSSFRRPQG